MAYEEYAGNSLGYISLTQGSFRHKSSTRGLKSSWNHGFVKLAIVTLVRELNTCYCRRGFQKESLKAS